MSDREINRRLYERSWELGRRSRGSLYEDTSKPFRDEDSWDLDRPRRSNSSEVKPHDPLELIPKPRAGITKLIWEKDGSDRFVEQRTQKPVVYATVETYKTIFKEGLLLEEIAERHMPKLANAYFVLKDTGTNLLIQYVRVM